TPTPGFGAPPSVTGATGGTAISVGQTVQGTLAQGDQLLDDGSFMDVYNLQLMQGQSVSIRLNSPDFDTFLIVEPPQGEPLVNDDFGGTLNSGLDFAAPAAGQYRVIVNAYSPGDSGNYSLSIN
ncbi:hypothetical protein JXA47_15945, partial [Candidatus Sumerlaeota bacterium]|nr:hypothetical protein [Candidatus Sumerlaeota bacterium]